MSASQLAGGHVTYAGFWWRVLAVLIDGVISWLLIVFVTFVAGLGMATATGDFDALYLLGKAAGPIGSFLYYTNWRRR
jgi:hypothetical protein